MIDTAVAVLHAEARLAYLQREISLSERMLAEHDRAHVSIHRAELLNGTPLYREVDPSVRARICQVCGVTFWEPKAHVGCHARYCDWCRQTRRTQTGAEYHRRVRRARLEGVGHE